MYILQLNYWRGPIDAWTLCESIAPPRIDAPGCQPILALKDDWKSDEKPDN